MPEEPKVGETHDEHKTDNPENVKQENDVQAKTQASSSDEAARYKTLVEELRREREAWRERFEEAKQTRDEIKAKLRKLKEEGRLLDDEAFEEYRRLKEQQRRIEEKKLLDKGKVDELIERKIREVAAEKDKVISEFKTQIEQLQAQMVEKDRAVRRALLHKQLASSPVREKTVLSAEKFVDLFAKHFDIVEEDGEVKIVGYYLDGNGERRSPIFSRRGTGYASVDEALDILINDERNADIRKATSGPPGIGVSSTEGTAPAKDDESTKIYTREEIKRIAALYRTDREQWEKLWPKVQRAVEERRVEGQTPRR